jgi:hypothetical protein
MKVKMKVGVSGTHDGVDWPPKGGVAEVSDVEGADLCARGLAEAVVEDRVEKRPAAKRAEKRA